MEEGEVPGGPGPMPNRLRSLDDIRSNQKRRSQSSEVPEALGNPCRGRSPLARKLDGREQHIRILTSTLKESPARRVTAGRAKERHQVQTQTQFVACHSHSQVRPQNKLRSAHAIDPDRLRSLVRRAIENHLAEHEYAILK